MKAYSYNLDTSAQVVKPVGIRQNPNTEWRSEQPDTLIVHTTGRFRQVFDGLNAIKFWVSSGRSGRSSALIRR